MSTLLDEETVVLEVLDFEPSCDCRTSGERCGEAATHSLECTECGKVTGLSCVTHTLYVRTSTVTMTHAVCGAQMPLRELLDAVPL